ncbi:MAG: hypothetical protein M0035_07935 [Actinomycetota bacterium]|nr:hypothetical protein [Actinomycetota bacterium]
MTTAWPGASICHARLRRDASELRLTTLRSTSHEAIRPEENATAMQALAGEQVSW